MSESVPIEIAGVACEVTAEGIQPQVPVQTLSEVVAAAEKGAICRALVATGHNRTHAAARLGINRRTLLNKIVLYGLQKRSNVLRGAGQ